MRYLLYATADIHPPSQIEPQYVAKHSLKRFNIIAFESAKRFLSYGRISLYGQTIIQNSSLMYMILLHKVYTLDIFNYKILLKHSFVLKYKILYKFLDLLLLCF